MLSRSSLAGLMLVAACSTTLARDHLYGALDNEDLLTCESLYWSGQPGPAATCYNRLYSPEQSALIRAEVLWAQGNLQGANSQFQQAITDAPDDPMVRVRWGELFMDTYQYNEAYNLFTEALELDPANAWAHIATWRASTPRTEPAASASTRARTPRRF